LGLLATDKGLARRFLGSPWAAEALWGKIEQSRPIHKRIQGPADLALSSVSKRVLSYAVEEADRLTRSVKDLCGLLELFEKRKVALISVAEALDTGSAAGRLVITIMGAVSQWEREAIGERTRDALRHKRGNGEQVGNIQFGYRLSADDRHLEPDGAEQAALAAIRDLRAAGHVSGTSPRP
jgi:hypothetical protein